MAQTRILATSMFADIVGYTDLMQRDEASAMRKLDQFKSSLEREIPLHNGELIQYFGDGCLAIFKSALDAISCARKLQQQWGQTDELAVRIGLHLGDVIRKDDNVYGDSVNLASRIESMGIPNSILLSESVRNSIKNQPEFQFQLLGKYEFKNVNEPLAVYALDIDDLQIPDPGSITGKLATANVKPSKSRQALLVAALALVTILAVGYYVLKPDVQSADELESSIAVLPFTNLSQDANQDYLSAGFTSEVNHQLSKIESLSVVSQTMTGQLVSQQKSSTEIAEELDVNYILEGTIQSAGERTRLIAYLTRMTDNEMIWSEEFDLNEVNLIDAQIQVSSGIAEKLPLNVSERKISQIQKIPTSNPLAYEFYLKALDSYHDFAWFSNLEDNETTIRYLEQALSHDPNFAQAYAMLAEIYIGASTIWGTNFKELSNRSIEYAKKAIQNDSLLPGPYIVIGKYERIKGIDTWRNWVNRALEIDPKTGLFEFYSDYYTKGDYINAFEYATLKLKRDPKSPLGYFALATIHSDLGNFERSLEIWNHFLDKGIKSNFIIGNMLNDYNSTSQTDKAVSIIKNLVAPRDSLIGSLWMGTAYFFARNWKVAEKYYLARDYLDMDYALIHLNTGREASAIKLFEDAIERRNASILEGPWVIRDLSRMYAAMGDFEKSYEYLNELDNRGDVHYPFLHVDPFFDRIRNEKRFQEYCDRVEAKKAKLRRQIQNLEKDLNLQI